MEREIPMRMAPVAPNSRTSLLFDPYPASGSHNDTKPCNVIGVPDADGAGTGCSIWIKLYIDIGVISAIIIAHHINPDR